MIGQRFQGTLWRCVVQYKALATEQQGEQQVTQMRFIVTADPAGGDLLEVAKLVALGSKPEIAQDFALQEVNRIAEVAGLGVAVGNDRGWPAGLDVGAVVLDATGRAQATIGDLRRALVLKDIAIAELEKQLRAARGEEAEEALQT